MRKFLTIFIPIIFLAICIMAMLSGPLLKNPWTEDENIISFIDNIERFSEENQWEQSEKEVEKVEKAWESILKRVQYTSEVDEIDDIYNNIARMKGGIRAKDLGITLGATEEIKTNWENLGK